MQEFRTLSSLKKKVNNILQENVSDKSVSNQKNEEKVHEELTEGGE